MHTVCCCRAAASLQVTQDCCSCLDACQFLNVICQLLCTANAFCHNYQIMTFADASVFQDLLDYFCTVDFFFFFREHNFFCAAAQTAPDCQITGVSAHNFYYRASFVGVGCITQFVQSIHTCVYCCVKTDCIFCTTHIQVDCSGNTDTVYAAFCQFYQTTVRTVTTDNYQRIQTQDLVDRCCFVYAFFCHHFGTTCCMQDGTTQIHYVRNVSAVQFFNFTADQTRITFTDTDYFDVMVFCCSNNGTDRRVHAGSVAATSQYTNFSDFFSFVLFCHSFFPPIKI